LTRRFRGWPGVLREETPTCVSYTLSTISQRSSLTETLGAGPSARKRTCTPTTSEEEVEEEEGDVSLRSIVHIPFSSIPDDAQISGKKF
jgi:hypothetical protein